MSRVLLKKGTIQLMIRNLIIALAFGGAAAAMAAPAFADDFCSDRPGQAVYACTIGKGNIQAESSLYEGSFVKGASLNQFGDTTLKYGLTDKIDLEVSLPLADELNVGKSHVWGVGDLTVASKIQLPWAGVTLMPFITAPTASAHMGTGTWEGGFAAPVAYTLSSKLTLNLSPAFTVVQNDNGRGQHVNSSDVINLSYAVAPKWTLVSEVAASYDLGGTDGVRANYWADEAVAYQFAKTLQLDAGVNVGLNRYTPNQIYVGVSKRF